MSTYLSGCKACWQFSSFGFPILSSEEERISSKQFIDMFLNLTIVFFKILEILDQYVFYELWFFRHQNWWKHSVDADERITLVFPGAKKTILFDRKNTENVLNI